MITIIEKTERFAKGNIGPLEWHAMESRIVATEPRWIAHAYRPHDASRDVGARIIASGAGATLRLAIESLVFDLGTLQGELRDGDACADALLSELLGIEAAEMEMRQREQAKALLTSKAAG